MQDQANFLVVDSEGIDAIIDSVAANPSSAKQAKSLLRDKLLRRRKVVSFPASREAVNDEDDMWDNVPV